MKAQRFLITSAGSKLSLITAFHEAVKRLPQPVELVLGDSNPDVLAAHLGYEFWAMPTMESISPEELTKEIVSREIDFILPTRDGELFFWAQQKKQLKDLGIKVFVSEPEAISLARDKFEFSRWGERLGLPIIPSRIEHQELSGRIIKKRRFGSGSVGFQIMESENVPDSSHFEMDRYIYQPFISGLEFSIDSWISNHGEIIGSVLRSRDCVIAGESRVTTTFRDVKVEHVADDVLKRLVVNFGLSGPVVLQGFLKENSEVHFIELNARTGGASTSSIHVGFDFAYWTLMEGLGQQLSSRDFKRSKSEVRVLRGVSDKVVILE